MLRHETQAALFAAEVIPLLFHHQSRDFLFYLERDGDRFLQFYWKHAGEQVEADGRSADEGLTHVFITLSDGRKTAVLTLPAPQNNGEAYFMALVPPLPGMQLLPWRRFGRVFALLRDKGQPGASATRLVEITRRALKVELHMQPQAQSEAFTRAVLSVLFPVKK